MLHLSPAFRHSLPAPLWRLRFGTLADDTPGLVAELRDGPARVLHLRAWRLPSGEPTGDSGLTLPWLAGVQAVTQGFLLYHRFDNDRLPVPTALGCLDLDTGQVRWEWPHHVLMGYDTALVMARRTALAEGETTEIFFRLPDGEPVAGRSLPVPDDGVQMPVMYAPTSPYWPVIDRFLKKNVRHSPMGAVAYLETAQAVVMAYTVYENTSALRSYLVVTDQSGAVIGHEEITPGNFSEAVVTDGTNFARYSETFCVWNQQLLILYQTNQLSSYLFHTTP